MGLGKDKETIIRSIHTLSDAERLDERRDDILCIYWLEIDDK